VDQFQRPGLSQVSGEDNDKVEKEEEHKLIRVYKKMKLPFLRGSKLFWLQTFRE
jgi:hypothetical protein